ncbi:MAG: DUF5655 domain-containing protein [Holophagaceae bacterium]
MAAKRYPYAVHPAVAYTQAIVDNLKAKSGRDLAGWLAHLRKAAPGGADAKALTAWLKSEGLGGTQAAVVAERAAKGGSHAFFEDTPEGYLKAADAYVEAMFAGPKAGLRPLFEALMDLGLALGKDVKACPCKTFVPLYRNHVFAQIKPTTRTRVDLGLALGDPATIQDPGGRLLDTGGFAKQDRITHRIAIAAPGDVDGEVSAWLKRAYDGDARA